MDRRSRSNYFNKCFKEAADEAVLKYIILCEGQDLIEKELKNKRPSLSDRILSLILKSDDASLIKTDELNKQTDDKSIVSNLQSIEVNENLPKENTSSLSDRILAPILTSDDASLIKTDELNKQTDDKSIVSNLQSVEVNENLPKENTSSLSDRILAPILTSDDASLIKTDELNKQTDDKSIVSKIKSYERRLKNTDVRIKDIITQTTKTCVLKNELCETHITLVDTVTQQQIILKKHEFNESQFGNTGNALTISPMISEGPISVLKSREILHSSTGEHDSTRLINEKPISYALPEVLVPKINENSKFSQKDKPILRPPTPYPKIGRSKMPHHSSSTRLLSLPKTQPIGPGFIEKEQESTLKDVRNVGAYSGWRKVLPAPHPIPRPPTPYQRIGRSKMPHHSSPTRLLSLPRTQLIGPGFIKKEQKSTLKDVRNVGGKTLPEFLVPKINENSKFSQKYKQIPRPPTPYPEIGRSKMPHHSSSTRLLSLPKTQPIGPGFIKKEQESTLKDVRNVGGYTLPEVLVPKINENSKFSQKDKPIPRPPTPYPEIGRSKMPHHSSSTRLLSLPKTQPIGPGFIKKEQ